MWKTSVFKTLIILSKIVKIFNDENTQEIRMNSRLIIEEIRDHYKKYNNLDVQSSKTSVVNLDETSTISSIAVLMDIILKKRQIYQQQKNQLHVLHLLIQVLKFQFYKSIFL
jgi:hypothetical protein